MEFRTGWVSGLGEDGALATVWGIFGMLSPGVNELGLMMPKDERCEEGGVSFR